MSPKAKKVTDKFHISLIDIIEKEFFCKVYDENILSDFDQKKLRITLDTRILPFPEKEELGIELKVIFHYKQKDNDLEIINFLAMTLFHITDYNKHITIQDPEILCFNDNLFPVLLSISIGTLRGLLYAKSSNKFGNKVILPLIDLDKLISRHKTDQK